MMIKITDKTTLEKILSVKGSHAVLEKFQTPCLHCPMAVYEMGQLTIGDIAKTYGIDLKKLLHELNEKAGAKK
jgi:hypothetical protein